MQPFNLLLAKPTTSYTRQGCSRAELDKTLPTKAVFLLDSEPCVQLSTKLDPY
jgi:hypothetical protein